MRFSIIRYNTYLRVIIFMGILLLPMIFLVLGIDFDVSLNEKREQAPPPKFRINRKFAKSVDRYFEDHFGGRKLLAKMALIYDYHLTKKPVVKNVLFGKEGWFYFGTPQVLKKYTGTGRLSAAQLDTVVQTILEQYRFCASLGIRYLLVIAPDKNTIYPEHLPNWLQGKSQVTALQQLKEAMRVYPNIKVLDLSRGIINAKSRGPLYLKTDTHWTQLGAFIGYRQIATQLSEWFPSVKTMKISDFKIKNKLLKGGDLAGMIGERQNIRESYPILARKKGWQAKRISTPPYYLNLYPLRGKRDNRFFIMASANHHFPKAVVFADSFIENLDSFLGEHFRQIVFHRRFIHTYAFDESLVLRERPDVVIMEVVERTLENVFSRGNSDNVKQVANQP